MWQIGAARLLGLELVCAPNLLYNGHMVHSDPHYSSLLLLGCGENGTVAADADDPLVIDTAALSDGRPFLNATFAK